MSENYESFDYSDVSTSGPPPLENGIYMASAVSAEPTTTQKGKAAIKVRWSITRDSEGNGISPKRSVFETLTLSKETLWRVKQCAEAASVTPPMNNSEDARLEFCEALLQAGDIYMKTKLEMYQGNAQMRVAAYLTQAEAAKAAAA